MPLTIIARCVHGLEWLCADELASCLPGIGGLALDRREITFTVPALTPGLLAVRTADDVFVDAGRCGGAGTTKDALPVIARGLGRLQWGALVDQVRRVRPIPDAPLIDVVASIEGRRSYNRFAIEQALGAELEPVLGGRYLRRTPQGREPGDADLTVRVFIRGDQAIAALRIAAQPAHRRPYKLATAPGTLHPPAAAALARLAAPADGELVLDPFCGDGTLAIETALAFPSAAVRGSDADPARILNAQRNAGRAGTRVGWSMADAGSIAGDVAGPGHATPGAAGDTDDDGSAAGPAGSDWAADAGAVVRPDIVLTNPPWNLAVDATGTLAGSLDPFWQKLPLVLAEGGRLVVLTDAALEVPGALRSLGYQLGPVAMLRLAGRICHVVLAAPPGQRLPTIPPGAERWRQQAIGSGVLTSSGF